MTNEQWEQFEDMAQRSGLRVLKVADNEYYIVDNNNHRLSAPYANNEAAALAMITNPPAPKPPSTTECATKAHLPGAKHKIKWKRKPRRNRNSLVEAL